MTSDHSKLIALVAICLAGMCCAATRVVAKEPPEAAVDVAPFARVAWWDPKVTIGTKAGRVEEFPAEDIAPYKEIAPAADGSYQVPATDGKGCVGLQWDETRLLRQLILRFPNAEAVPPVESVQLQRWAEGLYREDPWGGGSVWQGTWQTVEIAPNRVEDSLVWTCLASKQLASGTQKVRWVFSEVKQPIVLAGISAFTRSRCETVDVRVESTQPNSAGNATIAIFNGMILDPTEKSPYQCTWDTSKPLTLKVRYNVPERLKVDRTVLRFRLPDTAFGAAIEDLLANDCVYVPHAGLFVTRLPAPVTSAEYIKKIAGRKTVLEQVREQPDQDFARAWSVVHHPIQDNGPMMISLANDNRKFIVEREGVILFNEYDRPDDPKLSRLENLWNVFAGQWRCAPSFGSGKNPKVTRHLQGQWLPIPVTTVVDGSVIYEQTTYVAPMSDATADAPSWYRDHAVCLAEYRAQNGGNAAAPARLALSFADAKGKAVQLQEVKEGVLVVEGDRVLALIDTRQAAPLAVKREMAGAVLSGELPSGATAECFVCLPAWKVAPRDYALLLEAKGTTTQVEAYWTALLKPAMQIEIPDAFLSNIIKASQVHCMLAARNENRGGRISAWTASERYGPLESEANSVIRGMDMTGQTDFARRCSELFLSMCNQQGFITTGYALVGNGEILWTLAEHYERTRDRVWMKTVAPDVVRVCQWIIRQREKTKRLDAHGRKVPEYGLMPPGVTADWGRFTYRLFNDAQYYAGLENAGRALADIGDPAAPAIQEDAKQYREDIARAFHSLQARTPVVKLENGTWAPADPAFMDCLGRVEDFFPAEDSNRTWGNSVEIGVHHLAANQVLDPASKEVGWMLDYLEDVQFLRDGWGDYSEENTRKDVFCLGGFAKIQPYYGRTAELHAMRDDVKPFIRTYFNTIPTLVSKENLSFWEHFANGGAWNKTHETGWFLCQTRIMFVNEHGDELWLAPFVTDQWLKDEMKVAIRNAPTRFGPVGYTITSAVSSGHMEATIQLPTPTTAKRIVLRLRHPEGKPMRTVAVQGQAHKDFDAQRETITIKPTGQTITVRAEY